MRVAAASIALVALAVLAASAACGGSGSGGGADGKPAIVFGDLNWDSALFQTRVAQYVVEHGYGYPTETRFGTTLPLVQGLRRGDIQIHMEFWLPNLAEAREEAQASGEIVSAGTSLGDHVEIVVPGDLAARPGDGLAAARVIRLAEADLWREAAVETARLAPADEELRWLSILVNRTAAARLEHAESYALPLTWVFAGEYGQALDLIRAHPRRRRSRHTVR